jgi:hypothetical protein
MLKLDLEIKTFTIEGSEIERFVKQQIESQTGRKVKSLTFNIGNKSSGYGRDEYDIAYMSGCTVEFHPTGFNDSGIYSR